MFGKKFVGMLVFDVLKLGKCFYMVLIGMGIVFFVSLICDLEIYEKFDEVIFIYICCELVEFKYGEELVVVIKEDELIGEMVCEKFVYFMFVICDDGLVKGCVIDMINFGELFDYFGVLVFDLVVDWVMICGFEGLFKDIC